MKFKNNVNNDCPICLCEGRFLIQKYDDRYGQPDLVDYFYCEKCNIAFLKNRIKEDSLSAMYNKYYKFGHEEESPGVLRKVLAKLALREIISKIAGNIDLLDKVGKNENILEVGPAFNDASIEKIKKNELNWTALEVNEHCVENIKKKGLNSFCGTLKDLSENIKFDAILLSQAIEHQYDVNDFFSICRHILNPNGRIIFTTPNLDSIYKTKYGEVWINWHAPYHNFLLSKKSIKEICKKFDFKIIKFKTYTPTSWFFLQNNFSLPRRGEKNDKFNFNFSLMKQLLASIYLRIRELFKKNDGDCIYCELEINK